MHSFRYLLKASLIILMAFPVMKLNAEQPINDQLITKISSLINLKYKNLAGKKISRKIQILTPEKQISTLCLNPELSLTGNNIRFNENRSVVVQCGHVRKFIQISIHSSGTWWETLHPIPSGHVIQSGDIRSRSGSLDNLPYGTILDSQDILGRTATRYINQGQPLAESQLRKSWAIIAGHNVEVFSTGVGFQIRAHGKALDSAAVGQSARIALHTGQIVTGTVTAEGNVTINLKN